MSAFPAHWLALREPADRLARAAPLAQRLQRLPGVGPLWEIVDLGAGTGANCRYLAPLLGGIQHWRLVDYDRELLAVAAECIDSWATSRGARTTRTGDTQVLQARDFECHLRTESLDLASGFASIGLRTGTLVTASALLDLVSESWLQTLALRCREAIAPVLFALTYDGRISFDPPQRHDGLVRSLVNGHQLTNKGFGAALGPSAVRRSTEVLRALGYRVRCARSDWHLGPAEALLQAALIEGWVQAAAEVAPSQLTELASWHEQRRRHIERGTSRISVGHVDLLGWVPAPLVGGSEDALEH